MVSPLAYIPIGSRAPFIGALSDVVPFTHRDGLTYLRVLEELRKWLNDLVENVNSYGSELGELVTNELNAALQEIDSALSAQTDSVNAAINTLETEVNENLANQNDSVNALIESLTEYVDDAVASILDASVEVSDELVGQMLDDVDSITRSKLDALYAGKVDAVTTASVLYGTDAAGEAVPVPYSSTATANTVPRRTGAGQLPVPETPDTDTAAASKKYVDTARAALSTDISNITANSASVEDLLLIGRVDQTQTGNTNLASSAEYVLAVAPFDMEIVGLTMICDAAVNISGSTNAMTVRLIHRANSGASAVDVVSKTTAQQALGGTGTSDRRKPWSFNSGTWGSGDAVIVPAGEYISVVFSFTGTAALDLPATFTIQWRPVR